MAVRRDCRHYSTRTTPSGDIVQRCRVDAAEVAPFACPAGLPLLRGPLDHGRRLAALRARARGLDAAAVSPAAGGGAQDHVGLGGPPHQARARGPTSPRSAKAAGLRS